MGRIIADILVLIVITFAAWMMAVDLSDDCFSHDCSYQQELAKHARSKHRHV